MSSPLRRFAIVLEKADNTFTPGDTVAGRVVVKLNKTTNMRGLKICFLGRAEVKWSESTFSESNNYTTWYTQSEEYFRMEYYLVGGAGNSEMLAINRGAHVYRFNFTLPQNIPSSYEHDHGSVRYTINVVMDRPGKYNHRTSMLFTVETPWDLSQQPASKIPIEDEVIKDICCFPFFKMGTLLFNIYIPSTVYAIGDDIEARIVINNKSRIDVTKVELQLKQKMQLRTNESACKYGDTVEIAERRGPFKKDDDIFVRITVPNLPPSSFPYCSIIDIEYHLLIRIVISGCHCDVNRIYLISIGTRPILVSEEMQNGYTLSLPEQNPSPFVPKPATAPPVECLRDDQPTMSTVSLPENVPGNNDSGPNIPLHPQTSIQPETSSMESSSIGPAVHYSSVPRSTIKFILRKPGRASTAMMEQPPPSYDECMGLNTNN